jgi:hypothetical protein
MIRAHCRTNLDEWQMAKWPTVFAALPRVGDFVEGVMGDKRPWLRVVSVTHAERLDEKTRRPVPVVTVELHR